jgi:hypothetical protein
MKQMVRRPFTRPCQGSPGWCNRAMFWPVPEQIRLPRFLTIARSRVYAASSFALFLLPGGRPRRFVPAFTADIHAGGRPLRLPCPADNRWSTIIACSIPSRSSRSSASILLMSISAAYHPWKYHHRVRELPGDFLRCMKKRYPTLRRWHHSIAHCVNVNRHLDSRS